MSTTLPWSVKGVSDHARQVAKEASHKSGMTIGAWLTAVIEAHEKGQGAVQNKAERNIERLEEKVAELEQKITQAYGGLVKAVEMATDRIQALEQNGSRRPSSMA